MVPKLAQYNQSIGLPPFSPPTTVTKSYDAPLAFEPGKSWTYSTGMDWVGVLISRVSGLDLETYFQKHIFMPLGITDITFWPKKNSLLESRMASLSMRDPAVLQNAGKAVPNKGHNMQANIQEEFGGQGLYGSMPSYLKILKSVLIDDEQLLKTTTSALMFEPQLTPESQQALQSVFSNQPAAGPCSIGYFPSNIKYDWGLGGILSCEDMHDDQFNYRKKGCLNWSGMSNIFWV
jgi:CubicO group peptidase (beta-lactamase class C family)